MGENKANLVAEIRTTKTKIALIAKAIITAHATFTDLFHSFLSLSEQLDGKLNELELRAATVQQWENFILSQEVAEGEKKYVDKEQKEVVDNENNLKETENKMKKNASTLPSVIQMSLNGQLFAAPKEILLKYKGSLFEQMISHQQLEKIFFARDPKYFQYVLNFMLNRDLPVTSKEKKMEAIVKEFNYFKIPVEFETPFLDLSFNHNMIDEGKFAQIIKSWLPNKKFHLLYKASRDGFASTDFHRLCDNKGPTLTVIRSSEGYLFGGFTPLHWECRNTAKYDTESFIFTLTNPHNIPPTKYPHNQQKDKRAIWCGQSYGPCFGAGCDIDIPANPDKTDANCIFFPVSYVDSTGKGRYTFNGSRKFTAKEIEVFSVL